MVHKYHLLNFQTGSTLNLAALMIRDWLGILNFMMIIFSVLQIFKNLYSKFLTREIKVIQLYCNKYPLNNI